MRFMQESDLINLINTNLLNLQCDNLDSSINDTLVSFNQTLDSVKVDLEAEISEQTDEIFKKELEKLLGAVDTLIKMTESVTFLHVIDDEFFANVVLIILSTIMYLIEILSLIKMTIKYNVNCGEIGKKIADVTLYNLKYDISCLYKIVSQWRKVLITWIQHLSKCSEKEEIEDVQNFGFENLRDNFRFEQKPDETLNFENIVIPPNR